LRTNRTGFTPIAGRARRASEGYLNYLFDYPIFVLTDLALPAFLLVKWSRMREILAEAEIAAR
jgi:hypothetical protein